MATWPVNGADGPNEGPGLDHLHDRALCEPEGGKPMQLSASVVPVQAEPVPVKLDVMLTFTA
jgi:hypothetical protein